MVSPHLTSECDFFAWLRRVFNVIKWACCTGQPLFERFWRISFSLVGSSFTHLSLVLPPRFLHEVDTLLPDNLHLSISQRLDLKANYLCVRSAFSAIFRGEEDEEGAQENPPEIICSVDLLDPGSIHAQSFSKGISPIRPDQKPTAHVSSSANHQK